MMKQKFWKQFIRHIFIACAMLVGVLWAVSCEDEYTYDDKEPDFLGASIYDYLKDNGNYTYFVRLIKEGGYEPILSKTGSKTLFVASDSAFEKFFLDNPWGVHSFNELSRSQKRLIINYSMINNAYVIDALSNYNTGGNSEGSLIIGRAIRHKTAIDVLDTIPFEIGEALPDGPFWKYYKEKGIYVLRDETSWPLVHFFQKMMQIQEVPDEDFKTITDFTWQKGDAYIFDKKVIERDITCKNGYIHVLNGVLIPRKNMADFIQEEENLSTFASILDRFCAPYYSDDVTKSYRQNHPDFTDSIFVKKFYTKLNSSVDGIGLVISAYPNNKSIDPLLFLPFDPGWNSYHYVYPDPFFEIKMQADMGAMIVPNEDAFAEYLSPTGDGAMLKERFGSLSQVPDKIIVKLLNKHMRTSFFGSLPSRFGQMLDNDGFPYNISRTDIKDAYIGVNGVVYITDKVYPPIDFESVYAPVLFGSTTNTRIFDWVIQNNKYRYYLNTYDSKYAFIVPTDEYMKSYIDPITISKTQPGALKFWFDEVSNTVKATVYKYDKVTNTIGDSVRQITNSIFITNRLLKILDNHIIVGDFVPGKKVYLTRGNSTIWVNGTGTDMTIEGGGDIKLGGKVNVEQVHIQGNGHTYFVDKPIQPPLQSAYEVLSTTPEFSEFFDLLSGFPSNSSSVIFVNKASYYGSDYVVRFFNNYHYTVYVPTNDAINAAIANKIITPWESRPGIVGINDMVVNSTQYTTAISKLERFLRYHFQDNSLSISGTPLSNLIYQSAAVKIDDKVTHFNTLKKRYYKVGINGDGSNLTLTTETNNTVNVLTTNNLYNIYTCDYIFDKSPSSYTDIAGTVGASLTEYNQSTITTASSAVIHQIDNVLLFE